MSGTLAKIGFVVSLSTIPALAFQGYFLWPIWAAWFFSDRISYLTWHMLRDGPTIAIATVGLTLYLVGRTVFWKKPEATWERRILVFGLILFLIGAFWLYWYVHGFHDMVDQPMFLSDPMNPGEPWASFLGVAWSSLLLIVGGIFFFDWLYRFRRLQMIGIEIAFASFIILEDVSLLSVTMRRSGTLQRYSYYFLGYTTHQIVITILSFLITVGSLVFLYSQRNETRLLAVSILKKLGLTR